MIKKRVLNVLNTIDEPTCIAPVCFYSCYARDGDTVILPTFPQVTPTAAQPTAQPEPTSVPEPNWRRWATALFPPENRQ